MATSIEIQERRKTVIRLVMQGMTTDAIAKQLGVNVSTIDRDLAKLRSEMSKEELSQVAGEIAGLLAEKGRLRTQRLWSIISDKSSSRREILHAIKLLQDEDSATIKRCQTIGVLPKDPSPLISVSSSSDEGIAENKVQINIIAPEKCIKQDKELEKKQQEEKAKQEKKEGQHAD